jgi:hypothetical protein
VILKNSKNFKQHMMFYLIQKKKKFMINMVKKDLKMEEWEEDLEWTFSHKCLEEEVVKDNKDLKKLNLF